MADRLDWKVSVTPVKSTTGGGVDGGSITTDTIAYDFRRSLGGGNSSQTWNGADTAGWTETDGLPLHVHISSDGGTTGATGSGADGLWIKHTGFLYDAAEPDNVSSTAADSAADTVTVKTGSTAICTLVSGEGVFLPKVANATYNLTKAGDAVAVEYAIFT